MRKINTLSLTLQGVALRGAKGEPCGSWIAVRGLRNANTLSLTRTFTSAATRGRPAPSGNLGAWAPGRQPGRVGARQASWAPLHVEIERAQHQLHVSNHEL